MGWPAPSLNGRIAIVLHGALIGACVGGTADKGGLMVSRRGFLRLLGVVAGGPVMWRAGLPQAEPAALVYRKVYLGEVFIAGFRFHDGMRPEVMA